ncbi:MAG TPA: long-chain fatty acid--CoA ligase [Verrucomicrobiae bacterium]
MNLATAFAASVHNQPEKTAVFWGPDEFTYAALWRQANAVAAHLTRRLGVQPGDRVGLWLKNCPEFLDALFGILQAGAVVVPINNFLKPDEVSFILNDAGANVLITDKSMHEAVAKLVAARPSLQVLLVETFPTLPAGTAFPGSTAGESDLAVIIYTSGTTGKPKGAMLSHGNLLHNVESCRQVLRTVNADRFAVLLPMFHSYMLTVGLLLPLSVGGSIVLVRSLHPPRNALLEILQRQATILPAIPQFYRSMVSSPLQPPLPLRACISGAAPLPVQVLKDFETKFGIPLIEGYGLSEASPVVTKNPLDGRRKPGSIGVPIPNVEVSVQDDDGKLLPHHTVGEICVRGGNVMLGYWNQPEATAKTMRGDWLLTGDVGYQDSEGYFYITDRKKDMLLVNGNNVYPREIEEVLYEFGGVKEAAVIGVHDARKGEQPLAYVAAADGTTLDEKQLLTFLKQRLADYKLPRRIIFVEALPRNATGKILKTTLRQMTAEHRPV